MGMAASGQVDMTHGQVLGDVAETHAPALVAEVLAYAALGGPEAALGPGRAGRGGSRVADRLRPVGNASKRKTGMAPRRSRHAIRASGVRERPGDHSALVL
ncbi:hypothetical protein [Streptomyces goshikiensis]|uniref:hypothetical protein n=2 Tax=Streptomyces goshikiensis TaxID=1942 RepID=UPI00369DC179